MQFSLWRCLMQLLLSATVGLVFPIAGRAQDSDAPELPADPQQWVNSSPLSLEGLKGKGVVLVFFEETCPRCKAMWPEKVQESLKHQSEPVVYIGVISGTSRQDVEKYSRSVGVPWPMIVDYDRSLEKEYGVPEISLNNIIRTRIVDSKGEISPRRPSELSEQTTVALNGAKWRFDPEGLDASLVPAWRAIEVGDYQRAALPLKRALKSRDDGIKTKAESLQAVVLADLETLQAEFKKHQQSGEVWDAYKIQSQIAERFRGYPGAEESADQVRKLARDDMVKAELSAYKRLAIAKQVGSRGDPASIQRALGQLSSLVKDSPDTDAAVEAQSILDKFAQPPTE